jgi:hypothetical protein
MGYDAERLQGAIMGFLQANLGSSLDTVEALWAGSDPVNLPDAVSWHPGYKPTVLELASAAFPFISVMVPARNPIEGRRAEWGYQGVRLQAGLHIFVIADDEETVNKVAHRYAEAVVMSFQSQRVIGGYAQINYEPAVTLGQTIRHPTGGVTGDFFDDDDTDFIRLVQVRVDFEGG